MPIRSYLYVPGNRPDLFGKALASGADVVIQDLEDAVPATEKKVARQAVSVVLKSLPPVAIFVRLNAADAALADLAGLTVRGLSGVLLPKAEDPLLVSRIDETLAAMERAETRPPGSVLIQPLIETTVGLYGLAEIAAASARIRRFAFGAGDFVRDIRAEATPSRSETLYARMRLVARSRFLRLEPPVAHVFTPIKDIEGLRLACAEDRALGFYGRSCIHPSQIPIVNAAFTRGTDEIARARAILAAYAEANANGRGSLILDDGTFVDQAIAAKARDALVLASQESLHNESRLGASRQKGTRRTGHGHG
ncbi:citrate lyase subunit beta / citryl-CoA lyase [Rhizobiales bacterium GAS188]|nr:citrate lyase subunit beta / citryl-CoA lyase [Rhizobiales bacterium GAS188]